MNKEYIIHRQKQLEEERRLADEREAKKKAKEKAEREAERHRQKQILEAKEAERLRQKYDQKKEKLTEQKWNAHLKASRVQNKKRTQEDNKLKEIRIIIQNREPTLQVLDWANWSSDPLNQRLVDLDFERAIEVFKRDNLLAKRRRGTRDGRKIIDYALSFTGDTGASAAEDYVKTDFNPDDYNLNLGFTISYWVRPDEVGADMFCIGRKAHNNERFTFGISRSWKGYFGVGANQSERAFSTMLDTAGMDKATHLTYDADSDKWLLTIGKWYHFVVTYAGNNASTGEKYRKIYMNGQQIWGTGVSDPTYKGNIGWSQTGTEMSGGLSFGMRAVRGSGTNTSYNNGWACALDEVAIFNTEKDAAWVANVYKTNARRAPRTRRWKLDFRGESGLVGYWKFNKGTGVVVKDYSGNGNHGTFAAISGDTTAYPTWIID